MPIIIAGKLIIKSGLRDDFIKESAEAVMLARKNAACLDFSVSPDSVELNRVNVFEKWESRSTLDAFRDSGPDSNIFSLVETFDVKEYDVNT